MALRRRFEDITSAELAGEVALSGAVAVIPFAATEQHGAHLPVGTDAIIADGMVSMAISHVPETLAVTFLSVLRFGKSTEHTNLPGTIDLGWQTATQTLVEIGTSLARIGFRRLVIVSSHGGNTPAIDTAALELRRSANILVGTCSWMRFGYPEGILPAEEIASGIHGGAVETALMLHFRPELVRTPFIDAFPSLQDELAKEARHLRAHGRLGFGWMASDLNPIGTVGDARLATAEMGAAIADHQARGFAEFVADIAAFDLSRLG